MVILPLESGPCLWTVFVSILLKSLTAVTLQPSPQHSLYVFWYSDSKPKDPKSVFSSCRLPKVI